MSKRGAYKTTDKCWNKCVEKTKQFSTIEVGYWTVYQLLGYWCHLTNMPFEDLQCTPSRHPQVKKMKIIIAQVNDKKHYYADFDPHQVKNFLDWCWNIMQNSNKPCHSLSYIIGEGNKWIDNWKQDAYIKPIIDTEFDSTKLDIGGLDGVLDLQNQF